MAHSPQRHIGIVVLNYNSPDDVIKLVPQLCAQRGVTLSIIIVDNASRRDTVAQLSDWLESFDGSSERLAMSDLDRAEWGRPSTDGHHLYFIQNTVNSGYSAGNNVGIRLAERLGADAVLIANPDMRIEDSQYVNTLADELFASPEHFVAGSRILGVDGEDQNPLREPTFFEELTWFTFPFRRFWGGGSYLVRNANQVGATIEVPKVSGCCLMLRSDFLHRTSYLDEHVFLYCEEPILSARVRESGGKIVYVPKISAVHAHVPSQKGNDGRRMLEFLRSRRYYLQRYSGYSRAQLAMLSTSYCVLKWISIARSRRK